ncbi:F-box/kelch-repeat protein At1g16250 [Daucus carota subsp. sativus]|nr:PREDICTED: F-box/kelch-repeat protein At1g16250 [Daucus carota subsp. sativus]
METNKQAIIPGLPDDLALRCLAKLSHGYHGILETVSKGWRDVLRSSDYSNYKAREGWSGDWLFVLTEGSKNQWVAYDPEADKWHSLPNISGNSSTGQHYGFSCVTVCNKFLVIGGSYAPRDPIFPNQKPFITSDVVQYDPFTKRWTRAASMRTPRSHFACSVVCGKVYVAGGRTSQCARGLADVEVYDLATDKWEDLPPMPGPLMDCLGLSYQGKFYVLSDQVGLPEQKTSDVFDPSERTWYTVDDVWPFSRAMHFAVQVMTDDLVYTVVDWGESCIKSRDTEKGEWRHVGSVPPVNLPDHPRPLETFGYGFAALRKQLYVLGGRVLRWEESGVGRFDIVKLSSVRFCDPLVRPLNWRETRPMCVPAFGSILGCATMEEKTAS